MSITKRENSYQFRYQHNGKRHSMTWKIPQGLSQKQIEKEMRKAYADFVNMLEHGISMQAMTFQKLADEYIASIEKTSKPQTVMSHRNRLVKICTYIGDKDIKQICRNDIRSLISEMESKPYMVTKAGQEKYYSPASINDFLKTISCTLNYACQMDYIEGNILAGESGKGIKKPKMSADDSKMIPEDVLKAYCEEMQDAPLKFKAFFFLTLATGMRRGECLGLSWENIDFDNSTIDIVENAQRADDGSNILVTPKTSASRRCLSVDASVMQMLKDLQIEQKKQQLNLGYLWKHNPEKPTEEYCENHDKCEKQCKGFCSKHCSLFRPTNRVFTQDNGIPMDVKSPYDYLNKVSKRKGLPHISIHQLRHSTASHFIRNGEALPEIASYLGHANSKVTLNVYAHDIREAGKAKSLKTNVLQILKEA